MRLSRLSLPRDLHPDLGTPGSQVVTLKTQVQSLSQDDPLEEDVAIRSSILAWRIPWTEEPGGLQSTESQSQTQVKQLSTQR